MLSSGSEIIFTTYNILTRHETPRVYGIKKMQKRLNLINTFKVQLNI